MTVNRQPIRGGGAALIPQVYLHFDPVTQSARRSAGQSGSPLARQRMDFLILFSSRHRVVLEVDGKQHYANGDTASPALYSEMVSEDRRLRLAGYEVYRFGGTKLILGNFFVPGSRPERSGAGKECIRMLSTCPPRVTGAALVASSCPTTRCYW